MTVDDWEFGQAAIPRFLNGFVTLFPDETYDLLLKRIERTAQARAAGESSLRMFGLARENISFGMVPAWKRTQLGQDCIARLMSNEPVEELAKLFWIVAGYDEAAFKLITAISNLDGRGVRNLVVLIDNAIPSLVFTNPAFAKDILRRLTGEQRQLIVDALAYQASHFRIGSYSGLPGDYIADQQRRFTDNTAAFTDEPGFEDLARALRRLV